MGKYKEQLKLVQQDFGVLYTGRIDGIPGPKTDAAFKELCERADSEHQNRVIKGSKGNFEVLVAGKHLRVNNVRCTCFGGSDDSGDSGETASGYPTKGHPDLMAVALPMSYCGSDEATYEALCGSPIPLIPFGLYSNGEENREGAWVHITFSNGKTFLVPCIDFGPNINKYPDNAIDVTVALAKHQDPNATSNCFEDVVSYTIVNGAKFL